MRQIERSNPVSRFFFRNILYTCSLVHGIADAKAETDMPLSLSTSLIFSPICIDTKMWSRFSIFRWTLQTSAKQE